MATYEVLYSYTQNPVYDDIIVTADTVEQAELIAQTQLDEALPEGIEDVFIETIRELKN